MKGMKQGCCMGKWARYGYNVSQGILNSLQSFYVIYRYMIQTIWLLSVAEL